MTWGRRAIRAVWACVVLVLFSGLSLVSAHASLERSYPSANEFLTEAPIEVRLWFTEPLEPNFSRFTLRDSAGQMVATAPSAVEAGAAYEMFMPSEDLPDGLYTVLWRAVSTTDGHATEGSFTFGVNVAPARGAASFTEPEAVPYSVIVRTLNFIAYALLVGALGFAVLVWRPVTAALGETTAGRWLYRLMLLAWIFWGFANTLILVLQTSITAGLPFTQAMTDPALLTVLTGTTFGTLWFIRVGLWLVVGVIVVNTRRARWSLPLALAFTFAIVLTQSAFSHASAAQDRIVAVTADAAHLAASSLWVGGLVAFSLILVGLRRDRVTVSVSVGLLAAYFSNFARATVAMLVITGLYAAWLHVGSFDALTTTWYGRTLIVKVGLFVPLLAIAAVNFWLTRDRLRAPSASKTTLWVGRLRGLIAAEVVLTCAVLVAVGLLTSGSPARSTEAARAAAARPADEGGFFEMQQTPDQMVHLEILPGTVGPNEFIVTPYDADGRPLTDVSLVRLRFSAIDDPSVQSEIRPQSVDEGIFQEMGANLNMPGRWRVRLSIQRPGQFDTLYDFEVDVGPAPTIAQVTPDVQIPADQRAIAAGLLVAGFVMIGIFAAWQLSAQREGRKNPTGGA